MPHYLIRFSASPMAAEQILDQPRVCLKGVRAVANDLDGHLDGCWFKESDDGLIALLDTPRHLDKALLREAFALVWDGVDVEIESLLTLHEMNRRLREDDILLRTELWSDPVDLGSDLSFPASDPPGWITRDPVPSEEPV